MPHQTRIFRLFVSSTFSDMRAERKLLQRDVFPRLEALCQGRGARFQAVDLRWGVNEASQLDHRTLDICLGEIRRCQRLSPRPNFLILLGDRYGWQPLPSRIPAAEMEALRARISPAEDLGLLDAWYRRDDNAVPPEHVLVPRQGELAAYDRWEGVERRLRDVLRGAARGMDLPEARRACYFASATHQEILAGVLGGGSPAPLAGAAFAYVRTLCDLPDGEAAAPLAALKASLREKLGAGYREYGALDDGRAFADRVFEDLWGVIQAELAETAGENELRREEELHAELQARLVEHFGGRDRELSQLGTYLDGAGPGGPLALIGPSGSGKSSVMARAAEMARTRPGVTVSRFIGATSASTDVPTLLFGLCAEIARAFGKELGALAPRLGAERQREPATLGEIFRRCLALATAAKPVTVFLDALDQLAGADGAPALDWLPRHRPAFAKVVVSGLPELEPQLGGAEILRLGALPVSEAERILDGWLRDDRRTLTGSQRELLLKAFRASGQPIFLRLAYQRARTWRSGDAPALPADVSGVLNDFFDLLEREHTGDLVGTAVRYLLAARYRGLTEGELLELLFLDPAHRESVISHAHPDHRDELREVRKLPAVLWSRLFLDLEPYLTERDANGVPVTTFFHKLFVDFLAGRYAPTRACWENVARYYAARPLFHGEGEDAAPDLRKLTEQPHAQIRAGMFREAVETSVGAPAFLEAKVRAGLGSELQQDLSLYLDDERCSADRDRIAALSRFLRTEGHLLASHGRFPGFLLQQLWNDGAELAPGDELLEQVTGAVPLLLRKKAWRTAAATPSRRVRTLTGHSEVYAVALSADGRVGATAGRHDGIRVWDLQTGRCLRTLYTEGQQCMAMTACGRWLAAGKRGLTLYDLQAGTSRKLEPEEGRTLLSSVSFSAEGSRLASGWISDTTGNTPDRDTMAVWDVKTGKRVQGFAGFRELVSFLFLSPDGRYLYEGHPLRKWDVARGRRLVQVERLIPKAVSADGARVVDCGLKLLDSETGELVQECEGYSEDFFSHVVASADLTTVLATAPGDWDKRDFPLQAWNVLEGELLFSLPHPDQIITLAVTPDGRSALSATREAAYVWDLRPQVQAAAREVPGSDLHDASAEKLLFTPSGDRFLSADFHGVIQLVDVESGEKVRTLVGHEGPIWSAGVGDTGEVLATASHDHSLAVWDLGSDRPIFHTYAVELDAREKEKRIAKKLAELRKERAGGDPAKLGRLATMYALDDLPFFRRVAVTPDGSRVLASCDDRTVWVVGLPGPIRLGALEGAKGGVWEVDVSPDGSMVVACGATGNGDPCLRAWELESGTLLWETQGTQVTAFALSRDGRFLLTAESDRQVRFRSLRDGTPFDAVPARLEEVTSSPPFWSQVERIVMSTDGRRAFLCCGAGVGQYREEYFVRVLDLPSRKILATHHIEADHDRKRLFEVSRDGRWGIDTTRYERCLEVWDLATGTTRAVHEHPHPIKSLALDRGGRSLAIGDNSGGVVVFDAPGDRSAPAIVTARRIRHLGGAGEAGRWSETATVDCPLCGHRFPLDGGFSAAILRIAGPDAGAPPCLRLASGAWDDPELLCACPRCQGALQLNPFVVGAG